MARQVDQSEIPRRPSFSDASRQDLAASTARKTSPGRACSSASAGWASARSQIGQALLERLGGADFAVESAGIEPKGVIPYAVRVLAEVGIDWSGAESKPLAPILDQPFDYVITVCDRARQACPVFPGSTNSLHWGLHDPAEVEGSDEGKLAAFRHTRQESTQRLRPFIEIARRAAGIPVGGVIAL